MIVMTVTQADAIRGETTPGHCLAPVLLADGATYVLPEDVLTDPAHAEKRDILAGYPTRSVSVDEFTQAAATP